MMNSGYQLISLKDKTFTIGGASVKIPGTFAAIEYAYNISGKFCVLSDYLIGGVVRPASAIRFIKISDNYVGVITEAYVTATSVTAYTITVEPDDDVTIATAVITSAVSG